MNGGNNYNSLKVKTNSCLSKIRLYAGKSEYLVVGYFFGNKKTNPKNQQVQIISRKDFFIFLK